jgi:hypothetical protein
MAPRTRNRQKKKYKTVQSVTEKLAKSKYSTSYAMEKSLFEEE